VVEDWSHDLPADLQASFESELADSTPPPSGEQERFTEEAGEVTPVASWTRNLPPPLPRPQ
jgi:hypothetical protein